MIHRIETVIDYKGALVKVWLEVVDDKLDPEYVFLYEEVGETYYNIDRRNILREFKEPDLD